MDGTAVASVATVGSVPAAWSIVGVADFNGDGQADILWRHTSGAVVAWLMNGATVASVATVGSASSDWSIVGVADFNGDGKADILWRHASGAVVVWLINGPAAASVVTVGSVPSDWAIVGVADFDGYGMADILWRHASGAVVIWLMNGAMIAGVGSLGSVSTDWTIVGVADYNGLGTADILWRHTSGIVYEWVLAGTTVIGRGSPGDVGLDWHLVGAGTSCTLQGQIGYVAPPAYVVPASTPCQVSDASMLKDCTNQVRKGVRDAIEITAPLTCTGPGACLVDLTGVTRPVVVFGTPGAGAGFMRSDSYTYPIVDVSRGANITIANLVFDENVAVDCNQCVSTIRAFGTTNITLDHLTIAHSKGMGIEFRGSSNLIIRNSDIRDAGVFGIWSGSVDSFNVLIENNNFQDVRSSAIFFSYVGSSTIRHNTLKHNHRLAIFSTPGCQGPCPGGQLFLTLANNILVESNLITDGVVEVPGISGQASGIEMDQGLRDITITHNEIANNAGTGIAANPAARRSERSGYVQQTVRKRPWWGVPVFRF